MPDLFTLDKRGPASHYLNASPVDPKVVTVRGVAAISTGDGSQSQKVTTGKPLTIQSPVELKGGPATVYVYSEADNAPPNPKPFPS